MKVLPRWTLISSANITHQEWHGMKESFGGLAPLAFTLADVCICSICFKKHAVVSIEQLRISLKIQIDVVFRFTPEDIEVTECRIRRKVTDS